MDQHTNPLKYLGYNIVFQEVPNEVSLAINISNCPHRCKNCHSSYLWNDAGNLVTDDLAYLLNKYEKYISCVCFMGGDQNGRRIYYQCDGWRNHGENGSCY